MRAAVAHGHELVDLLLGRPVRDDPGRGVGDDDVEAAVALGELGGEAGDGGGVAHVEDPALHPAAGGGGTGHAGGRARDTRGVPAAEDDEVVRVEPGGEARGECETDALVGAGDESDPGGHAPTLGTVEGMPPTNVAHSWYA